MKKINNNNTIFGNIIIYGLSLIIFMNFSFVCGRNISIICSFIHIILSILFFFLAIQKKLHIRLTDNYFLCFLLLHY
jgi:hypothetical protein